VQTTASCSSWDRRFGARGAFLKLQLAFGSAPRIGSTAAESRAAAGVPPP
jgi:hypothetical protein